MKAKETLTNPRKASSAVTFVSLVAVVATSPITRSALVNFPDTASLPFFVGAEMFALMVTALVAGLSQDARAAGSPRLIQGAAILNAIGAIVMVADAFTPLPWFVSFAGGTACGVASIPLAALFMRRLSRGSLGENILLVSGAMGAATLVFWLTSLLPLVPRGIVWTLLLLAGTIGVAAIAGSSHLVASAGPLGQGEADPGRDKHARSRWRDFSTLASLLAVPLIGVFTFGLYIKAGVAPDGGRPLIFGIDEELALFLLAAGMLAAVGLVRPHRPLYASLYQVVVPAFACAILVVISFPNGSFVHSLGGLLVVFSMAFILLFALAAAATLVGSGETPALFAMSIVLGVYGVGRLAGIAFHSIVAPGPQAYEIYQIVVTVLLSVMLLVTAFQGRRRSTGTSLDGAQTIAGKIDETCAYLARTHGLSPRETEVLGLLARGYSPVYTAEKLVISESTARTHANRIYRKLGIGTREELLALVDETEKHL